MESGYLDKVAITAGFCFVVWLLHFAGADIGAFATFIAVGWFLSSLIR